jgi:hypothetical protein
VKEDTTNVVVSPLYGLREGFQRTFPPRPEARTTKAAADPTTTLARSIPQTKPPVKSAQSTITQPPRSKDVGLAESKSRSKHKPSKSLQFYLGFAFLPNTDRLLNVYSDSLFAQGSSVLGIWSRSKYPVRTAEHLFALTTVERALFPSPPAPISRIPITS